MAFQFQGLYSSVSNPYFLYHELQVYENWPNDSARKAYSARGALSAPVH